MICNITILVIEIYIDRQSILYKASVADSL